MGSGLRGAAEKIRVCVVEYNVLAASLLSRILEGDRGIEVLHHASILTPPCDEKPRVSVFVFDNASLPAPLSKYLRLVRFSFPDARTIVLDEQGSCEELCRLLFIGAHGFVPYSEVEHRLSSAVHAVSQGHLWITHEVLERYVSYSAQFSRIKEKGKKELTRRERSIIELLKRRFSNKEISSLLAISESTVKFHLSNVFAKLGVRDRYSVPEALSPETPSPQRAREVMLEKRE